MQFSTMSSEEVLPHDKNANSAEDLNAAEVLLSLNKPDTSKNQREHTTEKGTSVNPDSRDSSKKKELTVPNKSKGNMPSKETSMEKSQISQDTVTKYEFYVQDYHVIKGEKETLYLCDICDKSYLYLFSLKRHYLNTHINSVYLPANEIFNCKISEITVKKHYEKYKASRGLNQTQQNQREGISFCGNNDEEKSYPLLYCCNICMEMFDEKEPLKQHLGIHKTNNGYKNQLKQRSAKSNICSNSFQDADSKRRHEEESHTFCCDYCSLTFVQIEDLEKHVSVEHPELSQTHFHCQKEYVKVSVGAKSTNEVIAEDKKKSLSKGGKNSHLKYGCTEYDCNKRFNSYDNMRRHRRLNHNSYAGKNKTRSASRATDDDDDDDDFFETLSSHIAYNLANNVDGKNINQVPMDSSSEMETESSKHNIQWSLYNFPPNFELENSFDKNALMEHFWMEDDIECNNSSDLSHEAKSENVSDTETSVLKEFCSNSNKDIQFLLNSNKQQANEKIILPHLDVTEDATDSAVFVFSKKNQSSQEKQLSTYVCNVCCSAFCSKEKVEEHKLNNHINVLCTYMEFEDDTILPFLYFPSCSPFGAIHHSQCPPLTTPDMQLLCTKCKSAFFSTSDLHSHILQCASKHVTGNGCNDANLSSSVIKQNICIRTVKNKTDMVQPARLINLTNGKFTYSSLRNRLWKKFKKPKGNRNSECKQNCIDIPASNITHVVRSNYEKIVSNSTSLHQENDSISSVLDIPTENNSSLNSKKVTDAKNKLFQRDADLKENMQPVLPWCSHCRRGFSYMANYRKHVIDGCPIKKQKEEHQDNTPLDFTKQDETVKTLPVQRQAEQNIAEECRSELQGTGCNGPSETNVYQCQICHKTFQNVVNQMTCIMSHKLHSGESSTLKGCSFTEDGNSCNNTDFPEVSSNEIELPLIGEDVMQGTTANGSLNSQTISNVEGNTISLSTLIKKECDTLQNLITQEESHDLANKLKQTKSKGLSGKHKVSSDIHITRPCKKATSQGKKIERNHAPEKRTRNLCQTQKMSTQSNKQMPYGLRRKQKIIETLISLPLKRTRKAQTTDKMTTKIQGSFVSVNAKKTPKKKAQEKRSQVPVKGGLRKNSKL